MRTLLKVLVPATALIGIVLYAIESTQRIGGFLLYSLTPILIIYILLSLKQNNTKKNLPLKFRSLLLPVSIGTLLFIIIQRVFAPLHLPGTPLLALIVVGLSLATLLVGLIFFILNRKIADSFTYEIILVIFPSLIFIGQWMPLNVPAQEHIRLISESTYRLSKINQSLYNTNCENEEIKRIQEIKRDLINKAGGFGDDSRQLEDFFTKSGSFMIEENKTFFSSLNVSAELKDQLYETKAAGDALFILTELENELILKSCLNVKNF